MTTEQADAKSPAPQEPASLASLQKRIVTALVIAISFAWTGWIFFGSTPGQQDWRQFGISSGYEVYLGDYWTLFTSMFVHVNPLHFYFNAYWLWVLGGWVEERYGARFYALLIVLSGFCSSALELSFADGTGVGLSGVVYAIFGFLWGARLFGSHATDEVLPRQSVQIFLIWLVLCIGLTVTGALSVGNVAHVTGLIVGLLTAFAVVSPTRMVAKFAVPAVVLFSGASLLFSPWSYVWLQSRAARAQVRAQWAAAENYYTQLIERRPDDPWPLKYRGEIRLYLGHETEGQADLTRAEEAKHHRRTTR